MIATGTQIEDLITAAYHRIARPGAWVTLADLRDEVGERIGRHEMDAALRILGRRPQVHLVPESNTKALTEMDHMCAVVIGNQDKHLIAIG